jgi:hypothetical protein
MANTKTVKSSTNKKTTMELATRLQDPALAGAKRDRNVVRLGHDPAIADKAKEAAELKASIQEAETRFSTAQAALRAYGSSKRNLYNDTFKSDVITVAIPYTSETPEGEEVRYVSVICTDKHVVQKDAVLELLRTGTLNQKDFDALFTVETVRRLKANAEELIRGILIELGMVGNDLENAMQTLFDTEVKVSTTKDYEKKVREMDPNKRQLLDQLVRRVEPAVKF